MLLWVLIGLVVQGSRTDDAQVTVATYHHVEKEAMVHQLKFSENRQYCEGCVIWSFVLLNCLLMSFWLHGNGSRLLDWWMLGTPLLELTASAPPL